MEVRKWRLDKGLDKTVVT